MFGDYRYFNYIIGWLKARGLPVDKSQQGVLEKALEDELQKAKDSRVKEGLRLCQRVLQRVDHNAATREGQALLHEVMLGVEDGFFVSPMFKRDWDAICGVRSRKSAPCVMAKLVAYPKTRPSPEAKPKAVFPRVVQESVRLVQMEETLEDKVRALTAEVQELKKCLTLSAEVQELNSTLKSLGEQMQKLKGPSWQDLLFLENRIQEAIQYNRQETKKAIAAMRKAEPLWTGSQLPRVPRPLPDGIESLADCIKPVDELAPVRFPRTEGLLSLADVFDI